MTVALKTPRRVAPHSLGAPRPLRKTKVVVDFTLGGLHGTDRRE